MAWILKSGEKIVERPNSHLKDHPVNEVLLCEAFQCIESDGRDFIEEQIDFGHVIGNSSLVTTCDMDEIVFAIRPGRKGYTRFVKNREPEPCATIVVVLKRDSDNGTFVLITAFIGVKSLEPWDSRALPAHREFWEHRALIWGTQSIIAESATKTCPW